MTNIFFLYACGHSQIKKTTVSKLGGIDENKILGQDKTIENSTFEERPITEFMNRGQKQTDENSMHLQAQTNMRSIANDSQANKSISAENSITREVSSTSMLAHPLGTTEKGYSSTKAEHSLTKENSTTMQAHPLGTTGNGYSLTKEKNVSVVRPSNFDQVAYATAAVANLAHTTAAVASFTKPKLGYIFIFDFLH